MTEGDWKTLWWWGMIVVAAALLMVAVVHMTSCALVVVPVRKVVVPGARVTADVQVQPVPKDGGS